MVLITEDDPHARHSPPPLRGGYAPSHDAKSGAAGRPYFDARNGSDQMSAKNLRLPDGLAASRGARKSSATVCLISCLKSKRQVPVDN